MKRICLFTILFVLIFAFLTNNKKHIMTICKWDGSKAVSSSECIPRHKDACMNGCIYSSILSSATIWLADTLAILLSYAEYNRFII